MKIIFLTTFLTLVLSQVVNGQKLDQKTIDEKLGLKDKENVVYVVNGFPYGRVKLDSVLSSHPSGHLVELTKINNDGKLILGTANEVVLIVFAYQQKRKEIRKILKGLKNKFQDKYVGLSQHILNDAKNPVLYIDNNQVHHARAKEKFEHLKVGDIYYIDYKSEGQAPELYGQNAKNGLVRVWVKNNTE